MVKRVLVTGASGFVAGSVVYQADESWEVHALSRQPAPADRPRVFWHTTNLLDFQQLRQVFNQVGPAVVIHIAGVADIDFCQRNPEQANAINVDVTQELVSLCAATGARMVFTSTDTVFRGDKGLYTERDVPDPVNYYGHTKLLAEHAVATGLTDWVIARLAIVMGMPFLKDGNSFLSRLKHVLESGRNVPVAAEEVRSPVDVVTLGRALLELAAGEFQGIIHLGGNDRMDRLEFSRRIAERLGYPASQIVATASSAMVGRAPRPVDVSLDNSLARAELKTPLLGLMDGLELVLATAEDRNASAGACADGPDQGSTTNS